MPNCVKKSQLGELNLQPQRYKHFEITLMGYNHKAWVIDQMVRVLAGDRYDDIVRDACDSEEGPDIYEWDCGVAL